jgi:hypothetical protein
VCLDDGELSGVANISGNPAGYDNDFDEDKTLAMIYF